MSPLLVLLGVIVVPALAFVLIAYVLIPLAKGLGWMIAGTFRSIGWTFAHVFEFVGGMVGDTFRLLSTVPAIAVLSLMTLVSVALGRWSAAAHFGRTVRRELVTAGSCLYGIGIRRPLKLLWLHGLLEGLEQRVPAAMAAAPGRDRPAARRRFDGYTIVGSLATGGSGAKLYIAEPDAAKRARIRGMPEQVVIKSFALEEGSALPQIVRESRALESAKRLKAVLEHGMDPDRFWYVMPYYRGDHLGLVTRQLHAEAGADGLAGKRLRRGLGYVTELAGTLRSYHREGLWHKDVKPENVIVGDDGAHLVDLGLVTPLASAMTLTTHGTEYFRDPELVRQALRGVKVHQVDGAKFDIFGIGAVLYFVIENDFPAHGPLSRFRKRSPDAVKWIVRRAMADYQHRYASAEQLMNDLRVVAEADDPFAVRPGDLPSVRARALAEEDEEERFVDEHVAGPGTATGADTAVGREVADDDRFEVMAGDAARRAVRVTRAAAAAASSRVRAAREPGAERRPRLRRRGFMSSSYDVLDEVHRTAKAADVAGAAVGAPGRSACRMRRDARKAAAATRRRAMKTARAARRRARATAASSGRHARRRGPEGVVGAVVITLLAIGGILWLAVFETDGGGHAASPVGTAPAAPATPGAVAPVAGPPAVALLASESMREDPRLESAIARVTERREDHGYEVLLLPDAATERLLASIGRWEASGRTDEADRMLEDQLAAWGLFGVLELVPSQPGGRLVDRLVHSSRPDARERIPLTRLIDLPDPDRPLLLVNDHPRLVRPDVAARIDRVVAGLVQLGWTVTRDPEVEADLRTVLPIRTDAAEVPMTPVLAEKLDSYGLGGVLRVIGSPTEDDAVRLQVVRPDQVRARTLPVPPRFPFGSESPAGEGSGASTIAPPSAAAVPSATATASAAWRESRPTATLTAARRMVEARVAELAHRIEGEVDREIELAGAGIETGAQPRRCRD